MNFAILKVLIIYHSEHHGNTQKIAKAMAEKINADILNAVDVNGVFLKKDKLSIFFVILISTLISLL